MQVDSWKFRVCSTYYGMLSHDCLIAEWSVHTPKECLGTRQHMSTRGVRRQPRTVVFTVSFPNCLYFLIYRRISFTYWNLPNVNRIYKVIICKAILHLNISCYITGKKRLINKFLSILIIIIISYKKKIMHIMWLDFIWHIKNMSELEQRVVY